MLAPLSTSPLLDLLRRASSACAQLDELAQRDGGHDALGLEEGSCHRRRSMLLEPALDGHALKRMAVACRHRVMHDLPRDGT